MVPTRMQIDLTMRVTYFGPMKDMVEYKADEAVAAASIPWNTVVQSPFTMTPDDIQGFAQGLIENMKTNLLTNQQVQDWLGSLPGNAADIAKNITDANLPINASIVEFFLKQLQDNNTQYDNSPGGRRHLWARADCSSAVWGAFANHNPPYNTELGGYWATPFAEGVAGSGNPIPDTSWMLANINDKLIEIFKADTSDASARAKIITPALPNMVKGDLLFRKAKLVAGHGNDGHVAMVYENYPDTKTLDIVHCGSSTQVGKKNMGWSYVTTDYTHCYRPKVG
jgi:hypothetical protein